MQWGDTSFINDPVSSFIGKSSNANSFINLRKPNTKLIQTPSTYFDSRMMKVKILAEVYKR